MINRVVRFVPRRTPHAPLRNDLPDPGRPRGAAQRRRRTRWPAGRRTRLPSRRPPDRHRTDPSRAGRTARPPLAHDQRPNDLSPNDLSPNDPSAHDPRPTTRQPHDRARGSSRFASRPGRGAPSSGRRFATRQGRTPRTNGAQPARPDASIATPIAIAAAASSRRTTWPSWRRPVPSATPIRMLTSRVGATWLTGARRNAYRTSRYAIGLSTPTPTKAHRDARQARRTSSRRSQAAGARITARIVSESQV